jgi:hypothetical protein
MLMTVDYNSVHRRGESGGSGDAGSHQVVPLVPLDALHASERGREAAHEQAAQLHGSLVALRLRHAAARDRLVAFLAGTRAAATRRCCFAAWMARLSARKV